MSRFADLLQPDRGQPARPIHVVHPSAYADWLATQPIRVRSALTAQRVAGKAGNRAILPGEGAEDWSALLICDEDWDSPWKIASLPGTLPEGVYRVEGIDPGAAMLGWVLGQYRFERYRKAEDPAPRILLTSDPARIAEVLRIADATARARDLINTPALDCGPETLEREVEALANAHGAAHGVIRGRELETGYPMIHAVGMAAERGREPRLIELEWGNPAHPRIAIVGKGVTFDTGGLDIKPASGMRLMKKDMGGAAHAVALAELLMAAKLPVRLHLLVPAVENAISGPALRPGDVIRSRKGLSVEIANTDAEGRLILGDALAKAVEGAPALILDFATLTGAARVALGPDLPPVFANDDALAEALIAAGTIERDPLWRLPLWDGYEEMLKSDLADLNNSPDGGFAGAVTAALFLRRFVPREVPWAHIDTFAWRPAAKPGRPKGGDTLGMRAAWRVLRERFG